MSIHTLLCLMFLWFSSPSIAQDIFDPLNLRLASLISWRPQEWPETGQGIIVAVIDSGASVQDNELKKHLLPGWNFIKNTAIVTDLDGHGTAISGIIAQLAPNARVLPLLVTDNGAAQKQHVIQAIIYAINRGAHIINLSLSTSDEILCEVKSLIKEAQFEQSLFVIAGGNNWEELAALKQPYKNVIRVGATTLDYPIRLATYSVYGENVDIAAPAGAIADGITTHNAFNNSLRLFNGTSAATPVVAAAAALLKERLPTANGAQLRTLILQTSSTEKGLLVAQGRMLNLYNLLSKNEH